MSGAGTITNSSGVATLTFAPPAGTSTFAGVIQDGTAGQTALTFNGPGSTQILTGINTYSGVTTITAGTLQIGDGGADAAINGTLGIVNNGVLAFNSTLTTYCPAAISGSGTLVQAGNGGALILTGPSSYTGPTIVSGGTLGFAWPVGSVVPTVHLALNGSLGAINPGDTVPDISGNGNNGTMVGTDASYVAGKFGQGIQFPNHTGSYVQVPYTTAFAATNYTFSTWINTPYAGGGCIFNGRPGGGLNLDMYYYATGTPYYANNVVVEIPGTNGSWAETNPWVGVTLAPGTWNMLSITVGDSRMGPLRERPTGLRRFV